MKSTNVSSWSITKAVSLPDFQVLRYAKTDKAIPYCSYRTAKVQQRVEREREKKKKAKKLWSFLSTLAPLYTLINSSEAIETRALTTFLIQPTSRCSYPLLVYLAGSTVTFSTAIPIFRSGCPSLQLGLASPRYIWGYFMASQSQFMISSCFAQFRRYLRSRRHFATAVCSI